MKYRLKKYIGGLNGAIYLESSKSESNRALIINALAGGGSSNLHNLSNARDTRTMRSLLSDKTSTFDVKDAGTTMRFLTAYLAIHGDGETITGTERMKQRPIGPLVYALRSLGAKIEYLENEGYPPLKIHKIQTQKVAEIDIPGNISSQYISALLMIAPCLQNGLTINLTTEIFSAPYIQMTLDLMNVFGVDANWNGQIISIKNASYLTTDFTIEGDWSGASYWFGFLANGVGSLFLPTLKQHSSQGDQAIVEIMHQMGIASKYQDAGVHLTKESNKSNTIAYDFRKCPDLAQTVMVAAAANGIHLVMTGLESLKIKETDRIAAMQNELKKIGADLIEQGNEWIMKPSSNLPAQVEIETYEDHRMAMAFAPLSCLMDVTIDDPLVVDKSYPAFWEEVKKLGIEIDEVD